MNKIKIIDFKTINEYKNQYGYLLNFKRNKFITKEQLSKYKRGKFYKIDENLYLKLPRTTRKFWRIVTISLLGALVLGGGTTATMLYIPHKVALSSNKLELVASSTSCRLANDYKCSFKIKDDILGEEYMNNIDVDKMKVFVGGKQLSPDAFSFVYQTNKKNELTINRRYLCGEVKIETDLIKRTQSQNCFFFEYDVDSYANFSDAEFKVFSKGKVQRIKNGEIELFKKAIDIEHEHFSIDDLYLKDGYDMAVIEQGKYEVKVGSETRSLNFEHNSFIVREDNAFEVTIKSKSDNPLPKNIWLRSNARYTKKDEDFFAEFKDNDKTMVISVPYFFIRDNGSIRINPDVGDK